MPLTKCPDCGREISTSAPACPQCGRPMVPPQVPPPVAPGNPFQAARVVKPPSGKVLGCGWIFLICMGAVLGAVVLLSFVYEGDHPREQKLAPVPPSQNPEEQAKQPERDRLIKQMLSEGVFTKIEHRAGGLPKLYVGRPFHLLKIDEKKTFVHLVWSYYVTEDPKSEIVVLRDGYSGKEIGTYNATFGLRLD